MNDLPRCLKTCIVPAAGANHKMPSGEGKKELWRRDHTLRRWAAQAALVRSDLAGAMVLVQRAAARTTCRAGVVQYDIRMPLTLTAGRSNAAKESPHPGVSG